MNQRRGVQCVVTAPTLALAMGEPAQLLVKELEQLTDDAVVASLQFGQKSGDGCRGLVCTQVASSDGWCTVGAGTRRERRPWLTIYLRCAPGSMQWLHDARLLLHPPALRHACPSPRP